MKFVKVTEQFGHDWWIDVEKVVTVRPSFSTSPDAPPNAVIGSILEDVTGHSTFSEHKPDELMARLLAAKQGDTI